MCYRVKIFLFFFKVKEGRFVLLKQKETDYVLQETKQREGSSPGELKETDYVLQGKKTTTDG